MPELILAEKPSVGRDLARVLGCKSKGDGFLYSTQYVVTWAVGHLVSLFEPEDYDPSLKAWRAYKLPIIPSDIRIKPIPKTIAQFNVIKKLLNSPKITSIIVATDSGREGELIFRYIYHCLACTKPFKRLWISSMTDAAIKKGFSNLKSGSDFDNLYRSAKCRSEADWLVGINATRYYTLKYNTLLSVGRVQTPTLALVVEKQKEIDAFKPMDYWEIQGLFQADGEGKPEGNTIQVGGTIQEGKTIQEGAAFGVAMDGRKDEKGLGSLISYTGTWISKSSAKASPKSNPNESLQGGQGNAQDSEAKEKYDTKIPDKAKAEEIIRKVKGKQAVVTGIENEEKKQPPYLLYDLTELQRDCNRNFGFSAQKTLSIAQDLYEKRKLITYPRTDSHYLSSDMVSELRGKIQKLGIAEYKPYTDYLLGLEKLPITKRIVDDSKVSDHHAIITTDKVPNLKLLTADERKVYDLIVRRFIAAFYPNYIYRLTRLFTEVEGECFLSRGKTIVQLGFMLLFQGMEAADKAEGAKTDVGKEGSGKTEGKEEKGKKKTNTAADAEGSDGLLPNVSKGFVSTLVEAKLLTKKTQPPKPYTDASLLSAMENAGRFVEDEALKEQLKESGLGTPATRAAIIERLIQVAYLERKGKTLVPTEKAKMLISVVLPELKSPETTGKWEKGLGSIAKGKLTEQRFMESIKRYVVKITEG